jgi:hypothetical protein
VLGLSDESPRLVANLSRHAGGDRATLEDLIHQLERLTGLVMRSRVVSPEITGDGPLVRAHCAPIVLRHEHFRLERRSTYSDGTDVLSFVYTGGRERCSFNVYFHPRPQYAPGRLIRFDDLPDDDRRVYRQMRQYASLFMKMIVIFRERGLHLIWVDDLTQLGLTHYFLWFQMRKYSIIVTQLPDPMQVIVSFCVSGTLEDFCSLAPLMDSVVESIRAQEAIAHN